MKKLLLGVITFALIITSCNKYEDDFKDLNAKIDALSAQVAGVAALQAALTDVQTQLTTLSAAIAALPSTAATTALSNSLATITANVTGLQTALGTLATNVATGNVSTQALINQLITQTTANQVATTALVGSVQTALTAAIAASDVSLTATLITQLAAATAANDAAIAAAQAALALGNTDQTTALTALIAAMQASLATAQVDITQILANTSMYTGAVSILTDADVDFFMTKLAQMTLINGSLTVNPALITKLTDMNTILKKIIAVIGSNTVTIYCNVAAAKALDLSNLTSVSGNLTINGANLITASSIDISKLASVSGNLAYSLDGPISWPLLSGVGGTLTITPYTTTGSTIFGTTSVSMPLANVTGVICGGSLILPSATSVIMPATGLTVLSAVKATTLTVVNTTTAAANLIVTPKSTATVTLSFTSAAGALTVVNGTTVDLSNLATSVGALSVTTVAAGTVNLNTFNSDVAVTIVNAKTASLPLWAGGAASFLTAAAAETINLPVHTWVWSGAQTWPAVLTLTVGNANAPIALAPFTTLVTVTITGKTVSTWATLLATVTATAANTALKTVTLDGMIKSVNLTGLTAMTSLATSGVINGFTLVGASNAALTAITLGHAGFTSTADGTPGAFLTVTGSVATSLTASALDKVVGLSITGNTALRTLDFPALINLANVGVGTSASIVVTGNALRGAFTAAVAAVPGVSPYVEAVISATELLKLKPYLTLVAGSTYATKTYNLVYDKNATSPYTAFNLPAAMVTNDAVSVAINQTVAGNGIDVATEIAIIQ